MTLCITDQRFCNFKIQYFFLIGHTLPHTGNNPIPIVKIPGRLFSIIINFQTAIGYPFPVLQSGNMKHPGLQTGTQNGDLSLIRSPAAHNFPMSCFSGQGQIVCYNLKNRILSLPSDPFVFIHLLKTIVREKFFSPVFSFLIQGRQIRVHSQSKIPKRQNRSHITFQIIEILFT